MKTLAVILIIVVILGFVYFISLKLKAKPIIKPSLKPKPVLACQDDIDRAEEMRTDKDLMMDTISRYMQVEMVCPSTGEKMKLGGGSYIKYLQQMGWNLWSETKPKTIVGGREKIIRLSALDTLQQISIEPELVAGDEIQTGVVQKPIIFDLIKERFGSIKERSGMIRGKKCNSDVLEAEQNTTENEVTINRVIELICPYTNRRVGIQGYRKAYYLYTNLGWQQT